ncbi:MAG: AMP-dependent synthetase, partial [Armatimonadota bacterium]
MTQPVWYPTEAYTRGSHLEALMRRLGLGSYEELYRYSVEQPEVFFDATFRQMGLEWFRPYTRVLDTSQGPQWPQWFVGGELNLAYNAVGRHARAKPDAIALIWEGEDGQVIRLSYGELEARVAQAA